MALNLFERNPRGVRITAWALALGAVGAWYYNEWRKEREFSAAEVQQWNQEVLSKAAAAKSRKKRASKQSEDATAQ